MDLNILKSPMPAAPPPPGQATDFSQALDEQRRVQFIVTLVVVSTFSTACGVARLCARGFIGRRFGWDDFFALVALLLNLALIAAWCGEMQFGLVYRDWDLRLDYYMVYEPSFRYWSATSFLLFYYSYTCAKISILMLYLRVIEHTYLKFRVAVYVMIFAVSAIVIISTGVLLSFCQPVAKVFHDDLPGTCQVHPDLFFSQAVLTVVTDILVLVPPIPFIWRLSSSVSRKIGLLTLILFGLCVTAISMARTVIYNPNDAFTYELYDQFLQSYLCMIEINLAIASICMPTLPQLFKRIRGLHKHQSTVAPGQVLDPDSPGSPSDGSPSGASPRDNSGGKRRRSVVSQWMYGLYSTWRRSAVQSERSSGPFEKRAAARADSESSAPPPISPSAEEFAFVWQGDKQSAQQTTRGLRFDD